MNGTNGNEPGYPENALVPYPVIVAATMIDLRITRAENKTCMFGYRREPKTTLVRRAQAKRRRRADRAMRSEGFLPGAVYVPIEPFQQKKKVSRERLTCNFWSG